MPEVILIIFAAALIYYVAIKVAPKGLIFKLKKDEIESKKESVNEKEENSTEEQYLGDGQALLNKGDLDGAEKKFLSVVKLHPNSAPAYHFLGMIYLRQKIYKGAIASLEKACQLDPLNDTAFNNLGLAYFNTENYEQAINHIEKSISLNDKIAHRYLNLALCYKKVKNPERAAIALENASKIHPNAENLTQLARVYLEMNDKKLAKKTIEKLLEVDPKNSWAKREMAVLKD